MHAFLNINKIRGILFCAIIVSLYYLLWLPHLHREVFGFEAEKGWGTNLVLLGLILTQVVVIQAGDNARLTFGGRILNKFWDNGPWFVPNIFHFTIPLFNFALLWGLAVLQNNTYKRYEEKNVYVDISDTQMKYQANITMSYGQAQLSRILDVVKKLLFDWRRVPEEYYLASFGYRVFMAGIIMVCINSTVAHLNDKTNKVTTLMSQAVQQSTPAQQTRPAPEQQYVPPATSAAPQQVIKKPEPQKPKVFQFAFNNEVPTLDPSLLDQVTTLPYGSVLGMDDSRRSYFTFGPYPVKVPEQSLVSTRPVCGVIPQGGVARVIVSEPPRYMFNTHPSAIVSFVPGKPMRALSQYDSSEAYWETYMSWSALASDWDNHMDRYKINVNGKEHPEKPVMVIGVIAGDHPDHKVAVFCFGK